MNGIYWGEFKELLDNVTLRTEEVRPYHGISAELYDQMSVKDWDEAEYLALADQHAENILELGCGTGRILLGLASAGHKVVGIERSCSMLDILRERLGTMPAAVQERVLVVCADAADFELARRFNLILLPFLTLGLIDKPADRDSVARQAARHLTPSGLFVFDYLTVFDEQAASLAGEATSRDFWFKGRRLPARFGIKFYQQERALVVNTSWDLENGNEGPRHYVESKIERVFDSAEIEEMLDQAGLVITDRRSEALGDDGAVRRTVVRCRRRSERSHPLWHPYMAGPDVGGTSITLTEGYGCEVVDTEGRRYIDASGGLWSVQCGLRRPEIVDAIADQLRRLSYGTLFLGRCNEPALDLSRRLISMAISPLEWVYLTGSGSESVELSIKLARTFFSLQGRDTKKGILYLDASYHGTFFGSIGVSGLVSEAEAFSPLVPGMCAVPTPDPAKCPSGMGFEEYALQCAAVVERMLDQVADHIAAFIIEPILASAGVIIPPNAYFARIQRACRKHDVLLIMDEVATGFGRTGKWFASEHFGLRPDIMLLGKGINGGYLPLGAVLFSARIGEQLSAAGTPLAHGSTHNGNPACCAAAIATLDVIERERLLDRSQEFGGMFLARLQALSEMAGLGDVRGLGLMLFAGLTDESGQAANQAQVLAVQAAMQRQGVLVYIAPHGLIFCPALVISEGQIEAIVSCLAKVLVDYRLTNGRLSAREPAMSAL